MWQFFYYAHMLQSQTIINIIMDDGDQYFNFFNV
jgi:hypothetical protein